MKVVVTGASGLIGSALVPHLRQSGHDVVRLVRRAPGRRTRRAGTRSPGRSTPPPWTASTRAIHLAAAGIGDQRWTEAYKREILDSRVLGTATLARAMAELDRKPAVLVSQSAAGWYGDTGDAEVDESAPNAKGRFPADVVRAWEAAADPAREAGIRVVHPRSGLVMTKHGGALKRMLPIIRLGGGGPLGSGRQYWPIISLNDEIRALTYLLTSALEGPVNVCIPEVPTNKDFTKRVGAALHRPTLLPAPSFAIKVVIGGFADEVLASTRMVPTKLLADGFVFEDPTTDDVVRSALAD